MTDKPSSRGSEATEGSVTALWDATFREFAASTRHDFRGALNGVEVNLEVIRSRTAAGKTDHQALAPFLEAASDQLQQVTARGEAMHFLVRVQLGDAPQDVALTLKHLTTLMLPTAKSDGVDLTVAGYEGSVPTSAPAKAVALALASAFLAYIKEGGEVRVSLEKEPETVVRFSHESAGAVNLDPEVTAALLSHGIKARRSPQDLQILFP